MKLKNMQKNEDETLQSLNDFKNLVISSYL